MLDSFQAEQDMLLGITDANSKDDSDSDDKTVTTDSISTSVKFTWVYLSVCQ